MNGATTSAECKHEIHAYMEGMRALKIEDLSEISIRGAMLVFFSCKESNMKKNSNTKELPLPARYLEAR